MRRRLGIMSLRAAVGVFVAAVAILFVVYRLSDRREQVPNSPEHARPFMCEQCKHVFELTPQQRIELEKDADYDVPDHMTQGILLMQCPSCGQKAARDAWRCPHCNKVHLPPRYKPLGVCPSCGGQPG
jgi:rubrerythrin